MKRIITISPLRLVLLLFLLILIYPVFGQDSQFLTCPYIRKESYIHVTLTIIIFGIAIWLLRRKKQFKGVFVPHEGNGWTKYLKKKRNLIHKDDVDFPLSLLSGHFKTDLECLFHIL